MALLMSAKESVTPAGRQLAISVNYGKAREPGAPGIMTCHSAASFEFAANPAEHQFHKVSTKRSDINEEKVSLGNIEAKHSTKSSNFKQLKKCAEDKTICGSSQVSSLTSTHNSLSTRLRPQSTVGTNRNPLRQQRHVVGCEAWMELRGPQKIQSATRSEDGAAAVCPSASPCESLNHSATRSEDGAAAACPSASPCESLNHVSTPICSTYPCYLVPSLQLARSLINLVSRRLEVRTAQQQLVQVRVLLARSLINLVSRRLEVRTAQQQLVQVRVLLARSLINLVSRRLEVRTAQQQLVQVRVLLARSLINLVSRRLEVRTAQQQLVQVRVLLARSLINLVSRRLEVRTAQQQLVRVRILGESLNHLARSLINLVSRRLEVRTAQQQLVRVRILAPIQPYRAYRPLGVTVVERLACSSPTKAIRVQYPAGSESCRTMPFVRGVSQGSPVFPALSFWHSSIHHPPSSTLKISMGREIREIPDKTRRPTASSDTIPTCEKSVTRPGIEPGLPWSEASVHINARISKFFIRHALDDSEPIADLQGNKWRVAYCQVWSNWLLSEAAGNAETSELQVYTGLRSLADRRDWPTCILHASEVRCRGQHVTMWERAAWGRPLCGGVIKRRRLPLIAGCAAPPLIGHYERPSGHSQGRRGVVLVPGGPHKAGPRLAPLPLPPHHDTRSRILC
ncbi:hypothetical protein PR048_024823 [Dryococelus australis]|uniref:Uncharacterized protein n=1 Tax=Dryococelus australis TaxID=614101 RepID=A0ABQ9GPR1_9NEOP|nr:hypothetical protein PR048_024823 [Dryococelus australis]